MSQASDPPDCLAQGSLVNSLHKSGEKDSKAISVYLFPGETGECNWLCFVLRRDWALCNLFYNEYFICIMSTLFAEHLVQARC